MLRDRVSCVLLLLLLCLVSGGCGSGGQRVRTEAPPPPPRTGDDHVDVADGVWPFWPQQMRIHPLTQFMTDRRTGEQLIEVRIEFKDAYGHTCKAVGDVRIELYFENSTVAQQPAVEWPGNLRDMEVNRDYFDEVTQTYVFRLNVADLEIPDELEVKAYFWSGDGRYMLDTYPIRK